MFSLNNNALNLSNFMANAINASNLAYKLHSVGILIIT